MILLGLFHRASIERICYKINNVIQTLTIFVLLIGFVSFTFRFLGMLMRVLFTGLETGFREAGFGSMVTLAFRFFTLAGVLKRRF